VQGNLYLVSAILFGLRLGQKASLTLNNNYIVLPSGTKAKMRQPMADKSRDPPWVNLRPIRSIRSPAEIYPGISITDVMTEFTNLFSLMLTEFRFSPKKTKVLAILCKKRKQLTSLCGSVVKFVNCVLRWWGQEYLHVKKIGWPDASKCYRYQFRKDSTTGTMLVFTLAASRFNSKVCLFSLGLSRIIRAAHA